MASNRVYYAVQGASIANDGSSSFTLVHGLQSVGIDTNFNLDQVFELGQLAIYDNIENIPDISVSTEKVLDGYAPVYVLATQNSTGQDLAARGTGKCQMAFSVFDDAQKFASGTPIASVLMSGLVVQSVAYTFPSDGNFSESVTLVGNHKLWYSSPGSSPMAGASLFGPTEDSPLAVSPSGGVNRRQHIQFYPPTGTLTADANGSCNDNRVSVLPPLIPGISASGFNLKSGTNYSAHIQSINVSTNLGRDQIFELGRRAPYFRFVTFPTEVTCAIEVIDTGGDNISATEAGGTNGAAAGSNLKNESIRIRTREGLFLDLGTKNKIQSVSYNGGDTGGGNRTVTYNYSNFNEMSVSHLSDPVSALRPANLTAQQIANQG